MLEDDGSSGKADFESAGWALTFGCKFAPGPGTDVGVRRVELEFEGLGLAPEPEADHAVVRWAWRYPAFAEEGAALRAGNLSGGFEAGELEAEPDDAAARATRSNTCLEDWAEERLVVVCFALSTRPLVTPDHCVPMELGTSSGNSWRFCMSLGHQVNIALVEEDIAKLTSTLKPFHAPRRLAFFSSSSTKSTRMLTMLAVPSRLQSKMFHTVKMRSRAADSETRYDRRAFLIAVMAPGEFGKRDVTRATKAAFRLPSNSEHRGIYMSTISPTPQVEGLSLVGMAFDGGWAAGFEHRRLRCERESRRSSSLRTPLCASRPHEQARQ